MWVSIVGEYDWMDVDYGGGGEGVCCVSLCYH